MFTTTENGRLKLYIAETAEGILPGLSFSKYREFEADDDGAFPLPPDLLSALRLENGITGGSGAPTEAKFFVPDLNLAEAGEDLCEIID